MKYIRKFGVVTLALFAGFSCKDTDKAPVVTFDSATHGAYARLVAEGSRLVNLFDIDGSAYVYSVEFVDDAKGANVAEYIIDVNFLDNNTSNGDETTSIMGYLSFAKSSFETNDDGFQAVSDISLGASALISDLGITKADIMVGDEFEIVGRLVMNDGSVRTADESSSAVNGPAFRGHMTFILTASCPSDLSGDITWEIISANWPGVGTTGSFQMSEEADGVYSWGTYTFGLYQHLYACCEQEAGSVLKITDVCSTISLGSADGFGCSWAMTVDSVVGDVLTVTLFAGCTLPGIPPGITQVALTRVDGVTWSVIP